MKTKIKILTEATMLLIQNHSKKLKIMLRNDSHSKSCHKQLKNKEIKEQ